MCASSDPDLWPWRSWRPCSAKVTRLPLPESGGVPQETAPQEWLAAPASLGLLASLLAAVLAGGPQGEERGAGEEEEGRAGEAAGIGEDGTAAASWLRRVQHRRFALFFRSAGCAARHFGKFM